MQRDIDDLCGELAGVANALYIISGPFLEQDNRTPDPIVGEALHALAVHIDRIHDDMSNLQTLR